MRLAGASFSLRWSRLAGPSGGELRRLPLPPGCGSSSRWLYSSVTLTVVSVLRGLVGASSGQRSRARRLLAWVLMIVGPAVITRADPVRGSGLVGLKDRVEALGGNLAVQSPAGAGTALRVELPLTG